MAEDYLNPDLENNSTQSESLGAAYHNTDQENEGGFSIMPPMDQFSTQPLETGGMIQEESSVQDPENVNREEGTWTAPRDKEKITSKKQAQKKLSEVKKHIIYLIDMAGKAPDLVKKPDSLGNLVSLTEELDAFKEILSGNSEETTLNEADAEYLNVLSSDVEFSYGDVYNVIAAQARTAANNVKNIPQMANLDGGLKELIRTNFGDKNQDELDKIMNSLEGTAEYNAIVKMLKDSAWYVTGQIGEKVWAEGLDRLQKPLKDGLTKFRAKSEFIISFITGLIDIFGADKSHPTEGLRKTFDVIDSIVDNPFMKTTLPLWNLYRPAINFCLDGIDLIKKQRDDQFNQIGITKKLDQWVRKGEKDRINTSMTLGLPGNSEVSKLELLLFMMDIFMSKASQLTAPSSVQDYFYANMDLVNAGDGSDRLNEDYNNPLNPWDNEVESLEASVWLNRDIIWVMLYGNMLVPPKRRW